MHRVLLILALLGTFGSQSASAAPPAKPEIFRHLFVLPGDDRVAGERGRLRVPETAKPGARQIEIAFARLPSSAPRPGLPIVWIEGGPGASSIETFNEKPALIAMLREYGDVIVVDQRGAGESPEVLDCPQRWGLPLDRPITQGDIAADTRRIFGACAAQWRTQGVDLDGYNSAAYADDIIRVADALGYKQIRLHAFSYGTQIALAAMARHPARIERATLFGVMGLDSSLRDPSAFDGALSRAAAMLAASSAAKSYPPLDQLARRAIESVSARPITLQGAQDAAGKPINAVLDVTALKAFIVDSIGSRRELPELPRFLSTIANGNEGGAPLSAGDAVVKGLVDDMTWTRRGPAHRRSALQHYATVCASGISTTARAALLEKRKSTLLGQPQHAGLPEACDALKVADVGADLRAAKVVRMPLLLVGGSLDTKTPLEQAQSVAAAHPGSILITVAGAAHGDLVGSREVEPLVRAFLAGQSPAAQTINLPPIEFASP